MRLALFILVAALVSACSGQELNETLRDELLEMGRVDQEVRFRILDMLSQADLASLDNDEFRDDTDDDSDDTSGDGGSSGGSWGSGSGTTPGGWTCGTGGMSGTGAYYISGSSRYVYGCHSHRDYGASPNTIGHTRMTSGKFDHLVEAC